MCSVLPVGEKRRVQRVQGVLKPVEVGGSICYGLIRGSHCACTVRTGAMAMSVGSSVVAASRMCGGERDLHEKRQDTDKSHDLQSKSLQMKAK
jgi:hypothetical protein